MGSLLRHVADDVQVVGIVGGEEHVQDEEDEDKQPRVYGSRSLPVSPIYSASFLFIILVALSI